MVSKMYAIILNSSHEEGDSRVWPHASCCQSPILIYSPHTDCYHIGLPLLSTHNETTVTVQLKPQFVDSRFLLLNDLSDDLQQVTYIEACRLGKILQMIFISSGCDFTSFLVWEKLVFSTVFFQNALFICGKELSAGVTGCLSDDSNDVSLLSFYRLIVCVYFRKHRSAFDSSPHALYRNCGMIMIAWKTIPLTGFNISVMPYGTRWILKMKLSHQMMH